MFDFNKEPSALVIKMITEFIKQSFPQLVGIEIQSIENRIESHNIEASTNEIDNQFEIDNIQMYQSFSGVVVKFTKKEDDEIIPDIIWIPYLELLAFIKYN